MENQTQLMQDGSELTTFKTITLTLNSAELDVILSALDQRCLTATEGFLYRKIRNTRTELDD
jgi:hypothetical protein